MTVGTAGARALTATSAIGRRVFRLRSLVMLPVLAAFAAMFGCGADENAGSASGRDNSEQAAAAIHDSLAVPATRALVAFLQASREGSATSDDLETLTLCDAASATPFFPTRLLAAWTVLPFETRGDTVVARASVVTVAEQDIDRRGGGFVARERIQSDVLEWDVYRTAEGQWVVCNGLRFGYKGADSLTQWRPEGASLERAMRLVDSIGAARRFDSTGTR